MPASHRELLLAEVQRVFSEAVAGDTRGGTTWGRVLDSPYEGREFKGQNIMSLIEGTETYIEVLSPDKRDRALELDIQTRVYVPKGTSLRAGANTVLSDLEEIVEANNLWGGLAYATVFGANSVQREDTGDRVVEVSLFITLRYRTKRTDPRSS